MRRWLGWLVSNVYVKLDGIMFDYFFLSPFMVTVGCVRAKAFVRPHILDDVTMHEVVKGGVFYFIGMFMHKVTYGVLWVALGLVWVCCNVQDPNYTCQCYEEVPMRGNWTVWIFWTRIFSRLSGSFKGGLLV